MLVVLGACARVSTDRDGSGADGAPRPEVHASGDTSATGDTGPRPLAWTAIDAGYLSSCGLLTDGRLVCWGDDDEVAAAPAGPVAQVSVGLWGGCWLDPAGVASCWCANPTLSTHAPCDEAPEVGGLVRVEHAVAFACAERADATLACWGRRPGPAPDVPVLDWSIEENLGCAVVAPGDVVCWGQTSVWALADPDPALAPPAGLVYTQVAVGRDHACALDQDGEIHCWGSTAVQTAFPQAPPGPFVEVLAYNQVACGIRPDRTAVCWYDFPQLWDVDDVPPEADGGPSWEPPPGERWASIGLGEWDACGLTVEGEARCWMPQGDSAGEVLELPSLDDL
ncbi:MAG: RCC1 domain-containing protein [Myxococcota bacterium]